MSIDHTSFPAHKSELNPQSFVPEDVVKELSRICGQITNGWQEMGRYTSDKVEELPPDVPQPLNHHEQVAMLAILRSAQDRLLRVSANHEPALRAGAKSYPELAFITEEIDLAKQLVK